VNSFQQGMAKAAGVLGLHPDTLKHVAEIGGLGLLAGIPAYHLLRHHQGKPVGPGEEQKLHVLDLAGLGLLAAPSVLDLMRRGQH